MTDPSDPNARPPRRPDASRQPPTIDLKAKVVDDGVRPSAGPIPDEPSVSDASGPEAAGRRAEGREAEDRDSEGRDSEGRDSEGRDSEGTDTVGTEAASDDAAALADVTPDAPVSDADMGPLETAEAGTGREAEPRSEMPSAREPAPQRSSGFGPLAAAGLLGGLVGGGLVLAYDLWGAGRTQDETRIAQLEQRIAAIPRGDALQRLEARLGTLEGAQGTVNQRLQAAQALADRANARAEEIAARPAPAPQSTGPAPQTSAALTDFGNRIGALENQMRERSQAASTAAQATTAAVQGLERRLGDFDKRLGDVDKHLGDQDQKLAALTRQVAEGGSEATRAGTRVVLADRLNNALREGAPYAEVLGALERLNVEPARLQPLEPFASRGAPTAAALAQSFKPLSEPMLRDARPDGGSWTDRLTRMAERVVTVRAVNQPSDGSGGVPGLVARIEDSLARGALADAAATWDSLPEPARRLSEDWGRQLKQRVAAETAARALAADAVAALNPTTR